MFIRIFLLNKNCCSMSTTTNVATMREKRGRGRLDWPAGALQSGHGSIWSMSLPTRQQQNKTGRPRWQSGHSFTCSALLASLARSRAHGIVGHLMSHIQAVLRSAFSGGEGGGERERGMFGVIRGATLFRIFPFPVCLALSLSRSLSLCSRTVVKNILIRRHSIHV